MFIQNTFIIILNMEPEIGNVGNSFRALENCTDLINKRKIASVVLIFNAVSVSGVGAVWSVLLDCSESGLVQFYGCLEKD